MKRFLTLALHVFPGRPADADCVQGAGSLQDGAAESDHSPAESRPGAGAAGQGQGRPGCQAELC